MNMIINNFVNINFIIYEQKYFINCCSQDNNVNSLSDYALTKYVKNNNPPIKMIKNKDESNIKLGNNDEQEKGGSCRLPNVSKKDDKEVGISGFRRTKTKHFK